MTDDETARAALAGYIESQRVAQAFGSPEHAFCAAYAARTAMEFSADNYPLVVSR